MALRIGTAGWQVPRAVADRFPAEGSVLERYAAAFDAVEINSSFYRSHRPAIWERWRDAVPPDFRFAVKAPKTISHERRLADCADLVDRFLDETAVLGPKRGPVLVQLPPSLAFDPAVAEPFFALVRARFTGEVALEPRHPTWFAPEPDRLLADHRISRVAADPAVVPAAAIPGGWPGFAYQRLHGSPRMYWSSYPPEYLADLAVRLTSCDWCIFDNTASGAAAADALELQGLLTRS